MRRRFGRRKRKFPKMLIFIGLILVLGYSYYITEKRIKPTVEAMAEIKANLIANEVINNSVVEQLDTREYDDLIIIKTDKDGKVTLVQANTIKMNLLSTDTTTAIRKGLENIETQELKVPLSNITGSQILANTGPSIKINIQPAGSVSVDFKTEFVEAGINQTRFRIYLIVKTRIKIIAPTTSNEIDVTSNIPVAETIIVGDVPESYINVPGENNDYLNFVPTKDPFAAE